MLFRSMQKPGHPILSNTVSSVVQLLKHNDESCSELLALTIIQRHFNCIKKTVREPHSSISTPIDSVIGIEFSIFILIVDCREIAVKYMKLFYLFVISKISSIH